MRIIISVAVTLATVFAGLTIFKLLKSRKEEIQEYSTER